MAEYEDIDERNAQLQIQVSILAHEVIMLKKLIHEVSDCLGHIAEKLNEVK